MRTDFRLIVFLALVFSGCGSGEVIANSKSPNPSLDNGQREDTGFGAGLPRRSSTTERIYFERVLVDHGRIQTTIAVSFASPKSKSKIPFGFSLRLRRDLGVNPIFGLDPTRPEAAPAYDISRYGPHALAYWVRRETGAGEIRTLDLASGKEDSLAELSVPEGLGNGIVCPVWLGDTLYFGNFVNGVYLIERIRFSNGQGGPREIFALPPSSDEGFICPRTERPEAV